MGGSPRRGGISTTSYKILTLHTRKPPLCCGVPKNIVRRKHHVPVHGVPSTAIFVPNYVRYDAKTSLDY